jgi:polysaccharide deacetylase 2 family uncharacterized protein YibQ
MKMNNISNACESTLNSRCAASIMLRRMKRKMFLDAVQSNQYPERSLRSLLGTASQEANEPSTFDTSVSSLNSDASCQSSSELEGKIE